MRKVSFKIRNIGSEKYLSYILDDDCDFDEELLDYLDDNKIPELIDIIYEEDDVYDYLTYDITGRTTVESLLEKTMNAEMLCGIIRGVAAGIVNMRDLGIPVSYLILNRGFTYVNPVTYDVKMICVPIESDVSINAEFKTFAKSLITSARYSDKEDCNYVAKIITLLNADKFTIRTFAAQLTELMESAGMQVDDELGDIDLTQTVSESTGATSMDDLPEFNDVSFGDAEDDGLELYDEEPETEANSIFKDLDLDADEPTAAEPEAVETVDPFDDSQLDELKIDEGVSEEAEPAEAEPAETEPVETEEAVPENTDEAEPVEIENITEIPVEATLSDKSEDVTDTLTTEDINELIAPEVAQTAEGITEVVPEEPEKKPEPIDMDDIQGINDKPPVVKNIRINRAKIIQQAAEEIEDETTDNPTEQIATPEVPTADTEKADTDQDDAGATSELKAEEKPAAEPEKPAAAAVPKAMPYIVRVNTGERTMINKAVFKVGKATRGVDYTVKGNGAISKVHAIFHQKDDGMYLEDAKATNTTYVNGKALGEGEEVKLKNDTTIAMGGEDFLFKLN